MAVIFVTHDVGVAVEVADRVAVMYAGSLIELGSKAAIFYAAAHPYTRALLQAVPTLKTDRGQPLRTIEGSVPSARALPPGCPFEPRCSDRIAECAGSFPPFVEVGPGHWARCPVIN
jgi:oligopeptide/dipeptide ABC transporter ATP-binding protein